MIDAIGALRERVRLERPLRSEDELGGAQISWIDAGEAWAAVEARNAGERPAHDGVEQWAAYSVRINRAHGVQAGWRVAWSGRMLRVVGVLDSGAARVDLHCGEETP